MWNPGNVVHGREKPWRRRVGDLAKIVEVAIFKSDIRGQRRLQTAESGSIRVMKMIDTHIIYKRKVGVWQGGGFGDKAGNATWKRRQRRGGLSID